MKATPAVALLMLCAIASKALAVDSGCSVAPMRGAASPQGADGTMRVAGDGRACSIELLGVPAERRNPATAMRVTQPPGHGSVQFEGGRAVYRAHAGYRGADAFAVEADALGATNQSIVLRIRMAVTVTPPAP
jgi:hypothetical protein